MKIVLNYLAINTSLKHILRKNQVSIARSPLSKRSCINFQKTGNKLFQSLSNVIMYLVLQTKVLLLLLADLIFCKTHHMNALRQLQNLTLTVLDLSILLVVFPLHCYT